MLIITIQEKIPNVGLVPKVIPVKLFLGLILSPYVGVTRAMCGDPKRLYTYCSCLVYKKRENLQRGGDAYFDRDSRGDFLGEFPWPALKFLEFQSVGTR